MILEYVKIGLEVLIAFGIVIFFHEFGHFLLAKLNGVAVPEFAIGMGPEIVGFNYRGTRYKLCAFPIGGYCRMVGEEDDEELESSVPREQNFRYKRPIQKISIVFAGPFLNFILAILLFAIIHMAWGVPQTPPLDEVPLRATVSSVNEGYPAAQAGLQGGDIILGVDGRRPVETREVIEVIKNNPGNPVEFTILRNGDEKTIEITPRKAEDAEYGQIGAYLSDAIDYLFDTVIIAFLDPRRVGARAGLKMDDALVSVDGENARSAGQVKQILCENAGNEIPFVVKRGGERKTIGVTPKLNTVNNCGEIGAIFTPPAPRLIEEIVPGSPAYEAGLMAGDIILDFNDDSFPGQDYTLPEETVSMAVFRGGEGRIELAVSGATGASLGAELQPLNKKLGPFAAIAEGTRKSWQTVSLIGISLYKMARREVSADDVAGPVGIIQIASSFARSGFRELIGFFATISVCLGMINLFPFPALDGSRIVFHTWEAIIRRPLDPRRENMIHYVGFCILIALILFITYRDLRMLFGI